MTASKAKSFTAGLEPLRNGLSWVIARVPFNVPKTWPERKGLRVRGTIEGFAFRTSLFASKPGAEHFLLVNKKMQAAAEAQVGSKVRITLEPDLEEREDAAPPELAKSLEADRRLSRWYLKRSPSMRREVAKWITEPKSAASRLKRAEKMAERLYLVMEGETEPPPVLRAAFFRQPLAAEGWQALTPTQRRNHLLGIFYYESIEARERRAAKAVEEALSAVRKVSDCEK